MIPFVRRKSELAEVEAWPVRTVFARGFFKWRCASAGV